MNTKLKRLLTIIGAILIIIFIAIVITSVVSKKSREEKKLYDKLDTIVKEYYKDYYYPVVMGSSESLRLYNAKNLSETGIKVTLRQIVNSKGNDADSVLSQFKNYKTKNDCDYDNTKITIYPQDPFGNEDMKYESTIVCGF